MSSYTKAVVEEGRSILAMDRKVHGPRDRWNKFETFLYSVHGIYPVEEVHSDNFLCSSFNRRKNMLYRVKVQTNLETIVAGGADRSCITNAYAIELPKDPKKKAYEIKCNLDLSNRTQGRIVVPNGRERYATLGAGHTTAGVRAANAKAPTDVPGLQNGEGKLDLTLKKSQSPELAAMMDVGWDWKIIKDEVIETWGDQVAELCECAMNTQNNVGVPATEMEVALRAAGYMTECENANVDFKDTDATAIATSDMPPCTPYAAHLTKISCVYGGKDAVLVRFVSKVVETFNCHHSFGNEWTKAIASMIVLDKQRCMLYVRASLMILQMIGRKSMNGVGTTITTGKLSMLQQNKKLSLVVEADKLLQDAFEFSAQSVKKGIMTDGVATIAVGTFFERIAAHLAGIEKSAQHDEVFKTLLDVARKYCDDVAAAASADGNGVVGAKLSKPKGWAQLLKGVGAGAAAEPELAEAAPIVVTSTTKQSMLSPEEVLKQKGFVKGTAIQESKGDPTKLYKIQSISNGIVIVEEIIGLSEQTPRAVTIDWQKALEFWKVSKLPIETTFDYSTTKNSMFAASECRIIEEEKITIWNALITLKARRESNMSPLVYCCNPYNLRWAAAVEGIGDLVFCPCVPVANLVEKVGSDFDAKGTKGCQGCLKLGCILDPADGDEVRDKVFFAIKPIVSKAKTFPSDKDYILCPIFDIQTTDVESEANMDWLQIEHRAFEIPCMSNTRPIVKYEVLKIYAPKAVYVPLQSASSISGGGKRRRIHRAQAKPAGEE